MNAKARDIMSWNYRVCRDQGQRQGDYVSYSIREVYYDDDGKVLGWTATPATLLGDTPEEIKADLELILKDTFDRKILDITDEDNPRDIGPTAPGS